MGAMVLGAHHISRRDHSLASTIAGEISRTGSLLCSFGAYGYGAYAFFANEIPATHSNYPFVVFEIDPDQTTLCFGLGGRRFFLIRQPDQNQLYVAIKIMGFLNLPGFVSCPNQLYNFIR